MNLTRISPHFTPLNKGIYFGIDTESEAPRDITVEIIERSTERIIATKQMRDVTYTEVNIAPYITLHESYTPTKQQQTLFVDAPSERYAIRVDYSTSEEVIVSVNRQETDVFSIITSSPDTRRVARGEVDQILIAANRTLPMRAEVVTNTGETLTIEQVATSDMMILNLSTDGFATSVKSFDLYIYCDNLRLGNISYKLEPSRKGGVRLAWVSESGSIERYTFPLLHKAVRSAEKHYIDTPQGVKMVRCKAKERLFVSSRYEPCAMAEMLLQITSSPKVWIEKGANFEAVEVETTAIEHNIFGKPDRVAFELRKWQRGGKL